MGVVIIAVIIIGIYAYLKVREKYDYGADGKLHKYTDGYDKNGYDIYGYNKEGYNQQGYDRHGYDRQGFDRLGFDRYGRKADQKSSPQDCFTYRKGECSGINCNPKTCEDFRQAPHSPLDHKMPNERVF